MALLLHPDKNPRESAAGAFKKISDAFVTLSNPCERAEYDAGLDSGLGSEEESADERSTSTCPPERMPGPKSRKRPAGNHQTSRV